MFLVLLVVLVALVVLTNISSHPLLDNGEKQFNLVDPQLASQHIS